jgi:peroxiredoxin
MGIPIDKSKRTISQLIPVMLMGVGLIVIGLVTLSLLRKDNETSEVSVVPAAVNFPAPDISLDDQSGNKLSLTDYRQQVVLLNNWATWCPPCKSEMPTLQKYYQDHAKQGFMLIGIEAGDPRDIVASFVAEYNLSFPILLDPNNKSLISFHNDSLPSSYVIDHTGTVILSWTGPISRAMLEKYLTPLLEH